jgi:hypothetical protein
MMVLWSGRDILIPGSNQKNKERLGYDDGSKAKVYYRTSKTNGILHTWHMGRKFSRFAGSNIYNPPSLSSASSKLA